ncbi:DUF6265 family protein [Dawidia soli]|uniref:DUF6265 domain-containing protein n=1 Tax=Dawidia soli TaxID=2782352 RepID=A0AAP2D671_9BACT|nr:DUF6265 family protein [Dawidia soli]MBT1686116.1 hypothetical protein [Dawidia soli]
MKIPYYTLLRKCFVVLILIVLSGACSKAKRNEPVAVEATPYGRLKSAAWLLGAWRNSTSRGELYEAWRVKDDSTYAGRSCFVVGKDTVSSETVALAMRGGKLLYIPTVRDQNHGQPVTFTETTVTENEMIFENPVHDFPQRITYRQVGDDSLVAVISGMQGEKEKSVKFPMSRVR